jgi:hypothetical protein
MSTARDELHDLIERLPEEKVERWLEQIKGEIENQPFNAAAWWEDIDRLRANLQAKYGMMTSSADIINEMREERLNDIMGGE